MQDFVTMIQSFQVIDQNQDAFISPITLPKKQDCSRIKENATPEGM
jgi:DNA helicase-2/ATP-dependent DNA helicase PcrA